jgi:hypothetical protein
VQLHETVTSVTDGQHKPKYHLCRWEFFRFQDRESRLIRLYPVPALSSVSFPRQAARNAIRALPDDEAQPSPISSVGLKRAAKLPVFPAHGVFAHDQSGRPVQTRRIRHFYLNPHLVKRSKKGP